MLILTSGNYLGAFCKHEQRDAPALCDMLSDKLIRDNGWDGARSNRAAQLLAELLPAPAPALDPVTPEASQEAVPFAATETPSRSKFGFMGTPKEQDGAPPVPQQPLQPLGFDALLGDDWPLPPTEVGELVASLRWFTFTDPTDATGWHLRLAVEDPDEGRAWAVDARVTGDPLAMKAFV